MKYNLDQTYLNPSAKTLPYYLLMSFTLTQIEVHLLNNDLRERYDELIKNRGGDQAGYAWRQYNEATERAFDEWRDFAGDVKAVYLETKKSIEEVLELLDNSKKGGKPESLPLLKVGSGLSK